MIFNQLLKSRWVNIYEDPPEEEDKGEEEKKETPPVIDDEDKPVHSQKRLNSIMAEEKRKYNKEKDALIAQLGELKKSKGLSEKEKSDLQARIEALENSKLTTEQLAAKDKDKLIKERKEIEERLTKERDTWQSRYTQSTIERAILDAAGTNDGYDPEQFIAILGPNTRLVEGQDEDGNLTGVFIPSVKFKDVDKEGKPITLELSVPEAVKRMKDISRFANLFKSGATGGLGAGRDGGAAEKKSVKNPYSLSPAEFREWRKSQGINSKQFR